MVNDFGEAIDVFVAMPETRQTAQAKELNATNIDSKGAAPVMGFMGFARVRANPFLECRDNQRTRSCFLL